ncbi:DUF2066 domain-containing protein [Mesorhizobium sp. ZC-5]|uniref:DUF2066 domain-containing protein n=1 Tax=Mesorhizobium sp. ZC-5 TaxID=2986066 RepID=UPI0021E84BE7|nr:DUF2066 domain-containing protein [Mesorhizobium sp. ZC-5]MCV3239754.1 DUF2066 domain-containing protein [Mesorhizobium sp. ZC-5]
MLIASSGQSKGYGVIQNSRLFRPIVQIVLLLLFGLGTAHAARIDHLYRAQVVVSGQGEANRKAGFAICLEDVLVKLSGDPRLIGDPKVAEIAAKAGDLVAGYQYRDRMSGVPIHDEQGSYDRPHDLTVDFDQVKTDAVLEKLGREPWLSQRPPVVVFLDVTPRKGTAFRLVRAGDDRGEADMRVSLAAAAERAGMVIALPVQNTAKSMIQDATDLPGLDAEARNNGGNLALAGRLTWSDEAKGWIADWWMAAEGKNHEWQVRGVGFDEAFRNGMRGAAQILSGNGQPE